MRKLFLGIAGLVALCLAYSAPANATCGAGASTCFVVAAGGNSNATGTYSNTSGGASSGTTPASTDTVCLDSASGTSGNFVVNAALSIRALIADGVSTGGCTGASGSPFSHTMVLNSGQTVTFNGTNGAVLTLVSGMTFTDSGGTFAFVDTTTTDTNTIKSGGKTLPSMTIGAAGSSTTTFSVGDSWTLPSSKVITLTGGTLSNTGNFNMSIGGLSMTNSNTRSLVPGTGTWTFTSTGVVSVFDCTTTTGLTFSASTANWSIPGNVFSSAASIIGCGNNSSFNMGNWIISSSQSSTSAAGGPAFSTSGAYLNNLTLNGGFLNASNGITVTVNGTLTVTGTSSAPQEMASTGTTTYALTNNATANWAVFRGITFTTSHMTATNCFNIQDNNFGSGGSCSTPGGGGVIGD